MSKGASVLESFLRQRGHGSLASKASVGKIQGTAGTAGTPGTPWTAARIIIYFERLSICTIEG